MGKKISCKEYNHVINIWKKFEMKAMKEHDVSLLTDV